MNIRHLFATSLVLSLVSLSACSSGDGGASTGSSAGGGSDSGSSSSSSGSSSGGNVVTKPEPISLSGYDRSCIMDADCVLATSGDVCNLCRCPDGAINAKDKARYDGDVSETKKRCPPNTGEVACGPCEMKKAACQIGVCGAVSVE